MIAFYFPAWNRKNNCITEDFRIVAETQEAARKEVCQLHSKDWLIGDCRTAHYV